MLFLPYDQKAMLEGTTGKQKKEKTRIKGRIAARYLNCYGEKRTRGTGREVVYDRTKITNIGKLI